MTFLKILNCTDLRTTPFDQYSMGVDLRTTPIEQYFLGFGINLIKKVRWGVDQGSEWAFF